MEERLGARRNTGMTAANLRTWGMFMLIVGAVGKCIFQNNLAGMHSSNMQELLSWMSESDANMGYVTVAIIAQFVETGAVPIFAFLTFLGFTHTSDFTKYLLRVVGVALVSEIPYNLAMEGKFLAMSSRNPVFAVVLCLVVLWFFKRYGERSAKNFLLKVAIAFAAIIWAEMLQIQFGTPMLLVTLAFWICRNKPNFRNLVAGCAAMTCTLISPFYLVAPMAFLAIHGYNEEQGDQNRLVSYLIYPVLMLAVYLFATFAL